MLFGLHAKNLAHDGDKPLPQAHVGGFFVRCLVVPERLLKLRIGKCFCNELTHVLHAVGVGQPLLLNRLIKLVHLHAEQSFPVQGKQCCRVDRFVKEDLLGLVLSLWR